MTDDRADGPTFDLTDVGFLDFESRSQTDIEAGAWRYAIDADAIVLSYNIGVNSGVISHGFRCLSWDDMPYEVKAFHDRVRAGKAVWAAWNAGFDKAIWNYATIGFPEMANNHIIDVMAQATASGFPADLAMAAKLCGARHKAKSGNRLIALFCTPQGYKGVCGTPESHPEDWQEFLSYAAADVEAMHGVFTRTRQLTLAEWREYWAMERINERGVAIDLAMVDHAATLAAEDKVLSSKELLELSDGAIRTVDQVKVMTAWLERRLPPKGRDILVRREVEIDEETGVEKKPARYALTRKRVEKLLAYVNNDIDVGLDIGRHNNSETELLYKMRRILQIRLYGGSKTPAKFSRMQRQHVDGILYGQYVFNGASQTGRASSRGVQIHNLARDTLDYEHEAIEALLVATNYDGFCRVGDDSPVSRKLSLLIRPSFVAANNNMFVWSDWSQIEARILPWLCDHHEGARARLEIFREVDRDPSLPDLYTRTAAQLSHVSIPEVTRAMRQRGKVAELALGFLGGVGALQNMAAGYGMYLDDVDAQNTVTAWREANRWAGDYGRELWQAMEIARNLPGKRIPAGRCGFCYLPNYHGGSMLLQLPSGRFLTYRNIHREMVPEKDDDGKVVKLTCELTYARGYGRQKLWPGIFVENVTQGTAADFLRGTLVRLENDIYHGRMPVRLHTHDEVVLEVPEYATEATARELRSVMQQGFDWSQDLPLMSEESIAPYYTKRI